LQMIYLLSLYGMQWPCVTDVSQLTLEHVVRCCSTSLYNGRHDVDTKTKKTGTASKIRIHLCVFKRTNVYCAFSMKHGAYFMHLLEFNTVCMRTCMLLTSNALTLISIASPPCSDWYSRNRENDAHLVHYVRPAASGAAPSHCIQSIPLGRQNISDQKSHSVCGQWRFVLQ
jgi:hypothetical protein